MATATSSYTSSSCPRVTLSVSESSSNGGAVTYSYTLKYVTNGYTMSTSLKKTVKATIGGTSVYSGDITVGGKTTYTIKTGTISKNKAHSKATLSIYVEIQWGSASWSGTTLGTRTGSSSMTIPAKTSYSIVYNANGGSGTPSSQTKWYGETLTLTTTKPKRTGYTFSKWNTAAGGSGTSYASGASYTSNASRTLYAQWTANKYTITLNANGGSGGTTSITKTYNAAATLPSAANSPKRTNYKFLGWATSKSAKSPQWKAGATYTTNITANTTLYAVWELAYIAPTISGLSVFRCDSTGVQSDDGTYAKVTFGWKVDTTVNTSNAMKSLVVTFNGESKYTTTAGGTSGSVSTIISGISTETSYMVVVTLTDTTTGGKTVTKEAIVESAFYVLDFAAGGHGVGIGSAAPVTGLKIGMDTEVVGQVTAKTDYSGFVHRHNFSGTQVEFGVGIGGKAHGVYSRTRAKWIVHCDSDDGKVYVNGYEFGNNHTLWTGASYMTATHTATLSETVSSQPHGIVVVFSRYADSVAKNEQNFAFFIPKGFVTNYGGGGMVFSLLSPWANANKYIYIHDSKLVGNDNNNKVQTFNGISYENNYFVMKKVYGV